MKNIRGKQNIQSASNQWVTSTYRVESDQKDLIIKALRGDCENLKKNENQYHRLYDTYKQLQHKYKLLHDQKDNDDRQFKLRHEAAVRNISQLKNEIDALRAQLRDKKLETADLQSDQAALKQQFDEKNIELQNYRNDYKSCVADSEQLGAERQNLNNASIKLRGIIAQAQQECRLLKEDNDSVDRRLQELSRYQEQLLLQEKILKQKILGYQNQNNELDATINEYCENLSNLELGIKKAQDELTEIQQAVAELGLLNQKYKTQNNLTQKNIQAEVIKNNNFVKNLKNAQYTQKVRLGQVEEASQEVAGLRSQNQSLQRINQKLAQDLQACRAHLENLGLVNNKLVDHLQSFSQQDQSVREVLNRKGRVQFARGRVGEVSAHKFPLAQTKCPSSRAQYR